MSFHTSAETLKGWEKGLTAMMGVWVIGVLVVMIVPIPTFVLDLLLSFNMTISIIILLMSMYVLRPLDLSVFPSILLTVTLLRLSLNVASTRLILLHGNSGTDAAGQVIKAFGAFVVGGNYFVGVILFLVLTLINFVVITKGATRIAEVAARFTLDAMPGKQMSIDADLNAGLITEADARKRRKEIEKEADFYGAMDGASKFVRGDAIAGIVITIINVVGGLVIGVFQHGMGIGDAARTYTLLTVGDGLVAQVPALVVSTAAGLLVTRSTASSNLGVELARQVLIQPKAIATAGAILFVFGLIPGMPGLPFVIIAAIAGVIAYKMSSYIKATEEIEEQKPAVKTRESVERLLYLDMMGLEVGYGLIPLVDVGQDGELLHRIKSLRKQFAVEMGFIVPAIHIRDNLQLKPNEYSVLLKGIEIARGELIPDHYLAIIADGSKLPVKGIQTKEPAFGLPAVWINEKEKESIQAQGIVVVDCATVITTHLTEIIKSHADELLGRQEVRSLLDNLALDHPKVVDEIVPGLVSVGILQKVLQRLLQERVSIRDLLGILETLADYVPLTKNIDVLTGYVRQNLARTITKQYRDYNGNITAVILSPEIEDYLSKSLHHTEHESYLTADPDSIQKIVSSIQKYVNAFMARGLQPIVICSPKTRNPFKKVLDKFLPGVAVLSHNEITRDTNIQSLGMVEF